jgi:probable F420-dependent oxidoreductase
MLVEFGCSIPFTDVPDLRSALPAIAGGIESRGFESMWLGEHTHLPVETTHSYTKDGSLPDRYRRFPDPWAILAAAASVTNRIRLGTLVCLAAEHNPIILSKLIATVDQLSGGRVEVGVGYGWNKLEMINNGIDPSRRRTVLREKVQALKMLWSKDHVAFEGEFVRFTDSWSLPSPIQRPGPKIHLGCALTDRNLADLASFADGWFPQRALISADIRGDLNLVRKRLEADGRDPASLAVSVGHPGTSWGKVDVSKFEARLPSLAELATYEELGVQRVVCSVPATSPDLTAQCLDIWQARAAQARRN